MRSRGHRLTSSERHRLLGRLAEEIERQPDASLRELGTRLGVSQTTVARYRPLIVGDAVPSATQAVMPTVMVEGGTATVPAPTLPGEAGPPPAVDDTVVTCRLPVALTVWCDPPWDRLVEPNGAYARQSDRGAERESMDTNGDILYGRTDELEELVASVERERLVELCGPAGVGKTRLARAVAASVGATGALDIVRLVELASVREASRVADAVARALAIWDQPNRTVTETLVRALADRRCLLVFDNCEHVAPGVSAVITTLVASCPNLRVVATTQISMSMPVGLAHQVRPLPVPDAGALLDEISMSPAVQLFCARARAVRQAFAPDGADLRYVAEICRRLDGIPLAIELAASRISVLSLRQLLTRLRDRWRILAASGHADSPRHQTLQLALDWSYDLLSVPEKILLRRMAVFARYSNLAALEAVCGEPTADSSVLDTLAGLVSKSLVHADTDRDEARYHMLESVRLYAADRLQASGELAAIRRRHADWCLVEAEREEERLYGPDQESALQRLDGQYTDLHAGLDWAIYDKQAETALRLGGALGLYWRLRGAFRVGRSLLHYALAIDDESQVAASRGKALWALGLMRLMMYDRRCREPLEASLHLARSNRDQRGEARALLLLGNAAMHEADLDLALSTLHESIALARKVDDTWGLTHALGLAGLAFLSRGELPKARGVVDECLRVARMASDLQGTRIGLAVLAELELRVGNYATAQGVALEGIDVGGRLGEGMMIATCLRTVGEVQTGLGNYEKATTWLGEALHYSQQFGETFGVLRTMDVMTELAFTLGDCDAAQSWVDRAEATARADKWSWMSPAFWLVRIKAARGLDREAQVLFDEALARYGIDQISRCLVLAPTMASLGRLARERGEHQRAAILLGRALALYQRDGHIPGIVETIEDIAVYRLALGESPEATRLLGAAQSHRNAHEYARPPALLGCHEAALTAAREGLGDEQFSQMWQAGLSMPIDEAAAEALRTVGRRPRAAAGWDSLTRAEREVVSLVTEGLTNQQAADRLYVSRRTVETHLEHIFAKLGVRSRAKLAAEAFRRIE